MSLLLKDKLDKEAAELKKKLQVKKQMNVVFAHILRFPHGPNNRGGHPIFFSWFNIDGSITFFLLFDFDKSTFLGICRFANSINRCFRQIKKTIAI
jgi:hypothetical protein